MSGDEWDASAFWRHAPSGHSAPSDYKYMTCCLERGQLTNNGFPSGLDVYPARIQYPSAMLATERPVVAQLVEEISTISNSYSDAVGLFPLCSLEQQWPIFFFTQPQRALSSSAVPSCVINSSFELRKDRTHSHDERGPVSV